MFIKKSLAHASAHYTPPSALSCRLTSNYKRNALDASFPLWETGVFACYFLWNSHELCRCRSPPHFSSPVNWTRESKWRYIMQKINLRELYPDIYKTDTYLEISDEVQAVLSKRWAAHFPNGMPCGHRTENTARARQRRLALCFSQSASLI